MPHECLGRSIDGHPTFSIPAEAITFPYAHDGDEVRPRLVPSEPMSIIMNIAVRFVCVYIFSKISH